MTSEQISFFENLYQKYYEKMLKVALQIVKNPVTAADIVSETFLILIIRISTVMEHEDPVKWLFSVLKNNALYEYRKTKKHGELPLDEAMAKTAEPEFITIPDILPNDLTPDEQEILSLRLQDKLEYSVIAKRMNITEPACRMRFSRAKRHCADLLKEQEK